LAEEEELGEDADRFEDYAEDPEDLHKTPLIFLLKSQHHERRQNSTSHETRPSKLPRLLPLPRPRVDPYHQKYDVQRACNVEDLDDEVPHAIYLEEIQVSGDEDETVEGLRDEGYPLGGAVRMDRVYEDAFREDMRDVAENTKDVH